MDALNGVYENAADRTSRGGNIAVMGSEGCGKTTLTDNLVRAICCDLGLKATKEARLTRSGAEYEGSAEVVNNWRAASC